MYHRHLPRLSATLGLLALFFIALPGLARSTDLSNIVPDVAHDAVAPPDTLFHAELSHALDLVFSDRYAEAIVYLDSLKQVHPHHPAPFFYTAAAYQSWMSAFRFNAFQDKLEENVQKAIDVGNELIERKDDPWLNFYVGAAYGYRAFFRFREHNWVGAYFDGNKGISNFKKSLEKLPELYDVYLGLGSYHYWRTAKSKFIKVVAFWMKDRRKLGLDQIQFAIDHGIYCPEEATYGLVVAYYDYGEFKKALALNDRLNDTHMLEKGQVFMSDLYMRGRLKAHFEEWDEVIVIFQEILDRLTRAEHQSVGYQVECKYWIARALFKTGEYHKSFAMTEDAMQQRQYRKKEVELENPIDSFDDIMKELEDLYDTLSKQIKKGS